MPTLALDRPVFKTITIDVLLCIGVVAIPALSHATALPLYRLDPMRLLLFVAILATNRRNALLIAFWLPLLSLVTSGHPVFPKVVLIQGELMINTWVFCEIFRRSNRFALGAAVSIVASKALYYAAKYILIQTAVLSGVLVATPWGYQLVSFLFILLTGGLICRLSGWERGRAR